MTPGRLFHVLLLLTQLVTVVHKSISQFSNQLVALRPVLDVRNFMLSPVLPGLLLCRRLVPNSYQQNRRPQERICFARWLPGSGGGPEQLVLLTRTRFPDGGAGRESHKTPKCSCCSPELGSLGQLVTNAAPTLYTQTEGKSPCTFLLPAT